MPECHIIDYLTLLAQTILNWPLVIFVRTQLHSVHSATRPIFPSTGLMLVSR